MSLEGPAGRNRSASISSFVPVQDLEVEGAANSGVEDKDGGEHESEGEGRAEEDHTSNGGGSRKRNAAEPEEAASTGLAPPQSGGRTLRKGLSISLPSHSPKKLPTISPRDLSFVMSDLQEEIDRIEREQAEPKQLTPRVLYGLSPCRSLVRLCSLLASTPSARPPML